MSRDNVNRAITRLRQLNKAAAGKAAWEYAAQLLPVPAEYRTPADLAALLIFALGLYHAAAVRATEQYAYSTLVQLIERGHQGLVRGASARDVFGGSLPYPQQLENYRHVLCDLQSPLLMSAFEILFHGMRALQG